MAAHRQGQSPPSERMSSPASKRRQHSAPDHRPPISALFLIEFDVKAGYTVAWKQKTAGLQLHGVEYKSLPSGLHTVAEDLVYFLHEPDHAGVSAFVRADTDDEHARHARMMAVGVLVPLSFGRLGRAWRHAGDLKELAGTLSADRSRIDLLELYWARNRCKDTDPQPDAGDSPLASPLTWPRQGSRPVRTDGCASDGADPGPVRPQALSPYHPAWSLTGLLATFGPLIFPIYRAALLRKRILICTHVPVREACDSVYNLSVLSNIPLSVRDLVDRSASVERLGPLFNICLHDLSSLQEGWSATARDRAGWVACTTDRILATKDDVWDMLITVPPADSTRTKNHVWPTIEYPGGVPVRATQRDLDRFHRLAHALSRIGTPSGSREPRPTGSLVVADAERVVEPATWAALAYSGFMWWASAGEAHGEPAKEDAHDAALLADLDLSRPARKPAASGDDNCQEEEDDDDNDDDDQGAHVELAIIIYFHRLTTAMFDVLADTVANADEDDVPGSDLSPEGEEDEYGDENVLLGSMCDAVRVDCDALAQMGLDVWSRADADFAQAMAARYFARRAVVETKRVDVCGLRVC